MFQSIKRFSTALLFLTLISCGSNDGTPSRRPSASVEGFAVDAQIVSGTVTVYSFKEGVKGEVLGSTITDEKGFYAIDLSAPDQPILIEVRNGSYTEEASGNAVVLKQGQVLRAVTFYRSGTALSLMVTPYTNLAAGLVAYKVKQGTSIENAVTEATTALSTMAGIDILTTVPHNITDQTNAGTQFTQELKYGFMAAAISSWTAEAGESNGTDVHTIWNSIALSQVMYRDISEDGNLDGKGVDPDSQTVIDLGFGLVPIDANTYRAGFAEHFMKMVASDANKTGIKFAQAIGHAEHLGSLNHDMFGEMPPVPFDEEGPVSTPVEAEGLFHNGVFNFSVHVTDGVGVKAVSFDIDGVGIGDALDPSLPSIPINTTLYPDGDYKIGVRATDNLNNTSYRQFDIKFANSGTNINILSPTTVNSSPVTLSGTYIDNGTGIKSIVVQGLPADINIEDKTWNVQIPLVPPTPGQASAFVKAVSIVTTDSLDVVNSELITMTMDTIPPAFEPVPQYSNATFISGGLTFTQRLSFAKTSGIPVRIETDKISLNGVPILEGALGSSFIPYIVLRVEDTNINGIFTPENEINAEIQYTLDGSILAAFHPLVAVNTAGFYRFVIPLVSEVLHDDWHLATPQDQHDIDIVIKDRAGNSAAFNFTFHVEFVPPPPLITSNAINSFNKSFENRGQLHNASLLVSEHTFSNTTNQGMLFSPFDPSVHKVTNVLEEAVKLFQAMKYKAVEIQNWNFGTNSWGASSFAQLSEPPVEFMSFATEVLPPNIVLDDWATGGLVTEGGDRFKWRTRHVSRWSWASPPINSKAEITESASFSTERFEIQNEKGENQIDVNGWYAVLPGETYKVRRFVRTAAMNFYNDTELLGEFISSTALRLDKTLSWKIGNAIQIDFIHDAGFEKAEDMLPLTVSAGFGATTYTVSRATSS